jgi:uncharacterized membrane protein YcfT
VTPPPPKRERQTWMDSLRGIAVILVIFNHAVIFSTDLFDPPPTIANIVNLVFAPARMPLMVFLSGLLLQRSLDKGAGKHMIGKVRAVLYPLMVWTVLILGYELVSDAARGRPLAIPNIVDLAFDAPGHVWFLEYLFIYYVVAIALLVIPSWSMVAVGLVATLAAPESWDRFFLLMAFFFAGHMVASNPRMLAAASRSRRVMVAAALLAAAIPVFAVMQIDLRYESLAIPFVAALLVLAIRFGTYFTRTRIAAPFEFAGRLSLVFYLGHWFPTLFGALAAHRFFPGNAYLGVLGAFALGLTASWILAIGYQRFALVRAFFVWPSRKVSVTQDRP